VAVIAALTRSIAGVALWRWMALLLAAVLLVIALAGSGSSSPTVANVDGHVITLADYQQWLSALSETAHKSDSAVPPFSPDAPGYARCIAYEQAAARKSHAKVPNESTLRSSCSALRVALAENVVETLINGWWVLDQGAREHVSVSAAQVQRSVNSSLPKNTSLATLLAQSHLSRADLDFEAQVALTEQQLSDRHSGPTPKITAAQISAYYSANTSEMDGETLAQATPAIRDTLIGEKEEPVFQTYFTDTVQRYFQPLTTCSPGYRIAVYCR